MVLIGETAKWIDDNQLTQVQAAEIPGVSRPLCFAPVDPNATLPSYCHREDEKGNLATLVDKICPQCLFLQKYDRLLMLCTVLVPIRLEQANLLTRQINLIGIQLIMEKSTAHTKLAVVRQLIDEGKVNATKTAFNTAAELNVFTLSEMCKVVSSLTTKNFEKSMTTYQDHTKWQDVYLVTVNNTKAYVKLMVEEGVLIVSFKESES